MSHAEKCPVCEGSGSIVRGYPPETKTCNGCGGKGWVTIDDASQPLWVTPKTTG